MCFKSLMVTENERHLRRFILYIKFNHYMTETNFIYKIICIIHIYKLSLGLYSVYCWCYTCHSVVKSSSSDPVCHYYMLSPFTATSIQYEFTICSTIYLQDFLHVAAILLSSPHYFIMIGWQQLA